MTERQRELWPSDAVADQAAAVCRYIQTCETDQSQPNAFTIYRKLLDIGGATIDLRTETTDPDDLMLVTYDELKKGWIHRLMKHVQQHPNGGQTGRQPAIAQHFLQSAVPTTAKDITADHVVFSAESIDRLQYSVNDRTPQSVRILLAKFNHARETFIADTVDSAEYLSDVAKLIQDGKAPDWQAAVRMSHKHQSAGPAEQTAGYRQQMAATLKTGIN